MRLGELLDPRHQGEWTMGLCGLGMIHVNLGDRGSGHSQWELRSRLHAEAGLSAEDTKRRLTRMLLKATGHVERVVEGPNGPNLELLVDGEWVPLEDVLEAEAS